MQYDILFDFIKDNEELAKSVSRYVPWIKNSKDLRAFLDQRLIMLSAREVINHNMQGDGGAPRMALQLAILMGDRKASKPLMEYLFSRTYNYPFPVCGIQDLINTCTVADGTGARGSYYYQQKGGVYLPLIELSQIYLKNGGDPKYSLADRERFSKPMMAPYFPLEAPVAGHWPLGIGDVGGMFEYGLSAWMRSLKETFLRGWRFFKDPKFAYILKHYYGRTDESPKEWAEIERAAQGLRDPWMSNKSRILPCWAGILEDGIDQNDFRFRRAATLRVGLGWAHSHRDTLDLQLFAMGCQMTPDSGQRPGYGSPASQASEVHNVVVIDNQNWEGHAWVDELSDIPGSRIIHANGVPTLNMKGVKDIRRTVFMLDIDPGCTTSGMRRIGAEDRFLNDIRLPSGYLFDVYRVSGGKILSYPGLFSIKADIGQYKATITGIDHKKKFVTVSESMPVSLGSSFWEAGNEKHKTTMEVTRIEGNKLFYRKSFQLVSSRVKAVDVKNNIVIGKLVSILMGASEDNGLKPGMTEGLWLTNEKCSKWWSCHYLGGTRANGYQYKLTGTPIAPDDFKVNGTIEIFGLGKGDSVRLASYISVRRLADSGHAFEVVANTGGLLALGENAFPGGVEMSGDRIKWQKVKPGPDGSIRFTMNDLKNGKLYLRRL